MYPRKVETKFYEELNKTLPDLDCDNKFRKILEIFMAKVFSRCVLYFR